MELPGLTHAPFSDDSRSHGTDVAGIDPLLPRLFPKLATDVQWGLERSRRVLKSVGDPHLAYPTLHVGGTNGKGSVAAIWDAVLRAAGHRTGLYTSPHLCSFRERYRISGVPIDEEALVQAAGELQSLNERHGLTFFEAASVLAFHLFAQVQVDVGIVEVGLGGKLDATNVVQPLVTAVTNVALDHADYLGDSLVGIAGEKAGIIKAGVPLITTETDPELGRVFRERAGALGAPIHFLNPESDVEETDIGDRSTRFSLHTETWGRLELELPLVGAHQAVNAALAIRALELLPPELLPQREAVVAGTASVRWPGRFHLLEVEGVTWLFDVAHNIAGIEALARTLASHPLPRPVVLLVGILGDKEWRAMLPPLFEATDQAILTLPLSAPSERCWEPAEVVAAVESPGPVEIVPDFLEAARMAAARARGGSVLVVGSHHTTGDAMRVLGVEPFGPDPALPGPNPSF